MAVKTRIQLRSKSTSAQYRKPRVHFAVVERLHTDNLEDRYGPIFAKRLQHTTQLRQAHLQDGKGVSRTFAITFFPPRFATTEIRRINQQIKRGAPIGKAFRTHGYNIRKNVLRVEIMQAPSWLAAAFHEPVGKVKARISEFVARKGNEKPLVYGTVVEIYPRDFRPPSINAVDRSQVNPPVEALQKEGFSMEEIWTRIGAENHWGDVKSRFASAKRKSKEQVQEISKRVATVLAQRSR